MLPTGDQKTTSCDATRDAGSGRQDSTENRGKSSNGWEPFNSGNGERLLGILDSCFLLSYAIGVIWVGNMGEKANLRLVLSGGTLLDV